MTDAATEQPVEFAERLLVVHRCHTSVVRGPDHTSGSMTCDPNALQWIAGVGSPIATIIALVAVSYTARSAAAANRSAKAAEANVEEQTRPLLVDVPYGQHIDQIEDVVLPDGQVHKPAVGGEIYVSEDASWVSVPIRNVGRGVALVEAVALRARGHGPIPGARRIFSKRAVPPGEESRVAVTVSGDDHAYLSDAVKLTSDLEVIVTYSDLAGRSRQETTLTLGVLHLAGSNWRVVHVYSELV